MTLADRAAIAAEAGPLAAARSAARTAGEHAEQVDRHGRFPAEAVAAMRAAGLLGACAPVDLGGLGCTLREATHIAVVLARECSSAAMTWVMHQIQLACLVRHGGRGHLRDYAVRVCAEGLLLASATSEVGVGGQLRTSLAAIVPDGDRIIVDKDASTISYGAEADAVLATLRRGPDAAPGDQVLVVVPRDEADLAQRSEWDALGMRGTGSCGYRLRARIEPHWILADPFETILAETMIPYSHLLWSACWIGIAEAALERARGMLRERARKTPGTSSNTQLAREYGRVHAVRSALVELADVVDGIAVGESGDGRWRHEIRLNELKVTASETAVDSALAALAMTGFAGYSEVGPYSVGRQLRDALSAPLMVSNDRLLATNAGLLLTRKGDPSTW